MQIIENNPFRILGVWTNSPLRSLHANVTRMKAYLKVGKDISFPSDLSSFLPDIARTEALITQASASLNLSQDRIKYALFWFIEASSIDNVALGSLQKGDIVKAKNVLTKKETFSSLINEAIIDFVQDHPEDAIRKLSSVIHTDSYRSDFVNAICGESFDIDEFTLSQIFIETLNEELSIDVISSSLNDDDKELFHRIITDDLISKINNEIDASKGDRDDASFNITAGRKLMRNTKSSLTSLRSILGSANIKYKQTADDLANRILQCGINYFNASTGDKLVRVKNAKALQEYALSIAAGDIVKARCQENCDILNEIESTLPSYEVTNEDIAIRNILDNFSLDNEIEDAPKLIRDCAPFLIRIKEVQGSANAYYLNTSSNIANAALELTIKEVNKAISRLEQGNVSRVFTEINRRFLFERLKSCLKTAWKTILYIEKLDVEPEFTSNRLMPNKLSLHNLIEQLHGWDDLFYLGESGWAQDITADDLDMRTSEEVWKTCNSESSYKDFYERFPKSPHADEAKNKFMKIRSERERREKEEKERQKIKKEKEKKQENELLLKISNCSSLQDAQNLKTYCKTPSTRRAIDDKYFELCSKKKEYKQYCSLFGTGSRHYTDAQKASRTILDRFKKSGQALKKNKGWIIFIAICLAVLLGVYLIWGLDTVGGILGTLAVIAGFIGFGGIQDSDGCGFSIIMFLIAAVLGAASFAISSHLNSIKDAEKEKKAFAEIINNPDVDKCRSYCNSDYATNTDSVLSIWLTLVVDSCKNNIYGTRTYNGQNYRVENSGPLFELDYISARFKDHKIGRDAEKLLEYYCDSLYEVAKKDGSSMAWNNFIYAVPDDRIKDAEEKKTAALNYEENAAWGTEAKAWSEASKLNTADSYNKYLELYPNGKHHAMAEKKSIDMEVAGVYAGDHGTLPSMEKTGYGGGSTSQVSIDNNTSYILTVLYSGPSSKRIVLSPQESRTVTLTNGNYRIAAYVSASNVSRFAGSESLTGGAYSSSYYISSY